MLTRLLRFVAVLAAALSMGMSFAHTLEMPSKMRYDGRLWWHLSRTLYRPWWGRAGIAEAVAQAALALLAYRVPAQRPLMLGALASYFTALPIVFLACNQPANTATLESSPDDLPANWEELRRRWEYGHVIRFLLHLVGFCALLASLLPRTHERRPARRWLRR